MCIYVNGTGLKVNYVNATGAVYSAPGDATGLLWEDGSVLYYTNPDAWFSAPGLLNSSWPLGFDFPNDTQLCVSYKGKSAPTGKPCEYVYG